jgi:hypothetical protein
VAAWQVDGLGIENCVVLNKMSGSMLLSRCPALLMEHTVICRPMISAFVLRNEPDQPATMNHNIFTDMLAKKAKHNIGLFAVDHRLRCPRMRNNVFFLRCFPPEQRHISGKATASDLKDYIADPLFVDPRFAGDSSSADRFGPDVMMHPNVDLDFDSFFARDPRVIKRGIGLRREAFADFPFVSKTTGGE